MKPFTVHRGVAAPLDRANVDTDQIIPKQFLKKIERTGFGVHLFHDWRYLDDEGTKPNPDFVLNQASYKNASILLSRENFGCGSSREHAPWALSDFGIRSVIAPSFADIFYGNCFKNGMLPIILSAEHVNELFIFATKNPGSEIEISLTENKIVAGDKTYSFKLDEFKRECLLNGWDDIGLTLRHADAIQAFEKKHYETHPYFAVSK